MIIEPGHRVFFDKSGSPLHNGYVYIGAVDLDPQSNPVACYWDAALTQPAAQPFRTVYGHVHRNGSPANVYTSAAAYSVATYTSRKSLVYYEKNSDAFMSTGSGGSSSVVWGAITGTLADQADLNAQLAGKSSTSHSHTPASLGAIAATEKGAANGVATLGSDGKVPSGQLPPSSGGGTWGSITGTLSAQTDLDAALDAKADLLGIVNLSGPGPIALSAASHANRVLVWDGGTALVLQSVSGHGYAAGDFGFVYQKGAGAASLTSTTGPTILTSQGVGAAATHGTTGNWFEFMYDGTSFVVTRRSQPDASGGGGGGGAVSLANWFTVTTGPSTTAQEVVRTVTIPALAVGDSLSIEFEGAADATNTNEVRFICRWAGQDIAFRKIEDTNREIRHYCVAGVATLSQIRASSQGNGGGYPYYPTGAQARHTIDVSVSTTMQFILQRVVDTARACSFESIRVVHIPAAA